jgi:FtsH-binding integral membrane protein
LIEAIEPHMSESQTGTVTERSSELFDRYTLPKVALLVILAASLVGTWVNTALSGAGGPAFVILKWAYFVALGVLTGGLVWKHVFVRPADLADDAADYCAEMYDRFDRIATGAIAILVLGGTAITVQYLVAFDGGAPVIAYGALVGLWLGVTSLATILSRDVEGQFRSSLGLTALGLAVAVVVATAIAEISTPSRRVSGSSTCWPSRCGSVAPSGTSSLRSRRASSVRRSASFARRASNSSASGGPSGSSSRRCS